MIASSQIKDPRAVSLGAQLVTGTDPPPSSTPLYCLCGIVHGGFAHKHHVSAAGLDLLCVLRLCVQCVHRCHGAGHIVSFQGVLGP